MGIRIHKALGWGLSGVKSRNGVIADGRFNKCKNEDGWYSEAAEKISPFLDWVSNNKDEANALVSSVNGFEDKAFETFRLINSNKEIEKHFISYDFEYGIKDIVQFTPLGMSDWYRSDDSIDYYADIKQENNIIDLTKKCGIYPWLGMIKNPLAPLFESEVTCTYKLKDPLPQRIEPAIYNMLVGRWSNDSEPEASGEYLKYLQTWYRPCLPDDIILYTYYLGIFKDWEKTVQQLKPQLYTWWG